MKVSLVLGIARRACAVLLLVGAATASPAQGAFPDVLILDAIQRGCSPVTDTTAYPGSALPLFRFGVFEVGRDTLREASAAYWCAPRSGDGRAVLVIWRAAGDAPLPGGCAAVIPYWNPPGGLRFEPRSTVRLDGYRLVDEPGKSGPPVAARGTVIVSEHDGRSARFICHTGRWYVAMAP